MATLVFSVDSALLSELGEKLVESVHVALIELVKNAYDADATLVRIRISEAPKGHGPEVEVVDNGSGMTFEEVQQYWMRIATTNKRRHEYSPKYGRPRTGSKGIGRFSCRRLGRTLKLTTMAKAGKRGFEATDVVFKWRDFKPGTDITQVSCPGTRRLVEAGAIGTKLVIRDSPKNEWTRRGYHYLKRQLAVLVANRGTKRPGFADDPGFNILLEAPGFEQEEAAVDLRDQLIEGGWGTLIAQVDREGHAVCMLQANKIGTKRITSVRTFPSLRDVHLKVGIIYERKEQMRNPSLLSVGTVREILPEWGGVHVRFRGFRVYPYGEQHDDWLEIERDRARRKGSLDSKDLVHLATRLKGVDHTRVLLSLLSNRNFVGDVEIGPEATAFEMKANREGFVGDAAIGELKQFVRFAIDWSTIYRDHYLRLRAREDSEEARRQLEDILHVCMEPEKVVPTAIEYIEKEAKNIASLLPTRERQRVLTTFRSATSAILKRDKSSSMELQHLRLIASTSTLLLIFSHDVKSFLGNIEQTAIALKGMEGTLPDDQVRAIVEIREDLNRTKKRFIDLLEMTSLISVDSRSAEPARLALAARVDNARKCFDMIMRTYDIDVDISQVPTDIKVGPILEAELYAILLNVLSNAIKSVIAAGGTRRIEISAKRKGKESVIHVKDTGLGMSPRDAQELFVPFIADPKGTMYAALKSHLNPEDAYIVGTGSGLGLSIVSEILQSRGGGVRFVDPDRPWRADLEITLP